MEMKLILILLFIINPLSDNYLLIAESEINEKIEDKLTKNDQYFDKKLESFFKNYVTSNQIAVQNAEDGLIYHEYLEFLLHNGAGLNKIDENKQTKEIREELEIIDLNNESGIKNLFYKIVSPVVQKFKEELSKEEYEDELILEISKNKPSQYDNIDIALLINWLVHKYDPNDFNRPFLKKFVILFIFIQLELN
ncbi:hypothetical protein [Psychroflexus lacisalsi]|jgi:hypothetical protein|uniref:Uncharacterized protein n=1 Tax=Psychroflexus lacisalsi TaxID=503928 RepID=A0ABP3VNG5_9FLAO|nr:hypothetical protein [Psychroflexus lacisalsi]MBZ9621254.1 hypothetical protein [Psychroflexus lacisalsi]